MLRKRKRVEITMTDPIAARLEWLKVQTRAASLTDVIKDALELKEAVVKLQLAGTTILARDPSGVVGELFHPDKK